MSDLSSYTPPNAAPALEPETGVTSMPETVAAPAPDTVSISRADLDALIANAIAAGKANASTTSVADVVVPRKTAAELPKIGDVVAFEGHHAVVLELLEREVKEGDDPQHVVRLGVFRQTYLVDAERVES